MRGELDALKHEFFTQPLRVYRNANFVELADVEDTIHGALVEVHFILRHYFISSDAYDSFNGIVEQILVLQPGELLPQTVYKRKNVREGPIRMNPSLATHQPTQAPTQIASGSNIMLPVPAPMHDDSHVASSSSSAVPTILLMTVGEDVSEASISDNRTS